MDGRFGMAGRALIGDAFKLVVEVATGTFGGGVLAGEGEACLFMIKVGHAVCAVVAGQASGAKLLLVGGHEEGIMAVVAVGTGLDVDGEAVFCGVTVGANDGGGVIVHLMPDEAEGGHGMIEVRQPREGRVKVPPAMVRVAGAAGDVRIERGVKTGWGVQLFTDFGMTCDAQGGLFCIKRLVTGVAGFDFGVGGDATQH